MRNLLSVIFLLFTTILSAQIPTGYYDSARNLADNSLKYELNQIIDNHIEFYYTDSNTDV